MPLFGPPNIGQLEAKRDVQGLLKALGYTKDDSIRRQAAEALGKLGDLRAVDALAAALADRTSAVQAAAAQALGALKDVRAAAALEAALCAAGASDSQRTAAATALAGMGEMGFRALMQAAQSPAAGRDQREAAIRALGMARDARAVPFLAGLLEQFDTLWIWLAAEALGEIGGDQAAEALVAVLNRIETSERAKAALRKLGPRAFDALAAGLQQGPAVHTACVSLLAPLNDPRAIEPLVAALARGPFLVENAQWFRGHAEALRALGWQPSGVTGARYWAALGEWDRCAEMGPEGFEMLVAHMRGKSQLWHNDRYKAAEALGRLQDPRTVPDFIAVLLDEEQDQLVHVMAARALGNLRDARAVAPLTTFLARAKYPNEREAAIEALGRFQQIETAVEPLLATLQSPHWIARKQAAETLVKLYHEGRLKPEERQAILAVRPLIIQPHHHSSVYSSYLDDDVVTDTGIGVEFPV